MSLQIFKRRFVIAFASVIAVAALAAAAQLWVITQLDGNTQQIELIGQQRVLDLRMRVQLDQIWHADSADHLASYRAALAHSQQSFNQGLQNMQAMHTDSAKALLAQAQAQWQPFNVLITDVLQTAGQADAVVGDDQFAV